MKQRRNEGFTLIEVIVVAGIISILAGVLVPMILKEIDESRITRASADIRSISNALIIMKKDTGGWPVSASCTPGTTLLTGAGTVPSINVGVTGWDTTSQVSYNDYMLNDAQECWPNTWKGPYMAAVTQDPWGRSYITNADNFPLQGGAIWIISAGSDGVVDTPGNNNIVLGDDIGLRIK